MFTLFFFQNLALFDLFAFFVVDDPLDAVAVHLGGGLWGIISMPLFAQGGIIYGINSESTLVSSTKVPVIIYHLETKWYLDILLDNYIHNNHIN